MSRHVYKILDQNCNGEQRAIAEIAFEQNNKKGVVLAQFRYLDDYLKHPQAKPIDPANLPLTNSVFEFPALPGALNDVLPDRWGREVALKINQIPCNDTAGLIDWISPDHIGSLSFVRAGEQVIQRAIGPAKELLARLDTETRKFEDSATPAVTAQWAFTLASGASVGGARRKTLISSEGVGYLVKFQQKADPFNMPRVEHATMTLAKRVGLQVAHTQIETLNDKDVLLVQRFDIVNELPCRQLLSFDSLLNSQATHYGELAQILIQHVSTSRLGSCLLQLFRQMCFNICINNTDDHLKNFSLLRDDKGWCTSPAYDLVPGSSLGEYHQLGFGNTIIPPQGEALVRYANQYFHLTDAKVLEVMHACDKTVSHWRDHFAEQGVASDDIKYLEKIIKPSLTT